MPGPFLGALILTVFVQSSNFSGTWTLVGVNDKPVDAAAKPVTVVITQTARDLEMKTGDQTLAVTLGGSEQTIKLPQTSPYPPPEVKVRARLEQDRLIVEQRTSTTQIVQTARLSPDGRELTVETVVQNAQGERREKQRFKKS